jgi:hypothetical protein
MIPQKFWHNKRMVLQESLLKSKKIELTALKGVLIKPEKN